jgi:hypothetical protein
VVIPYRFFATNYRSLEYGTYRLSRNVCTDLPLYAA